MNDAFAIPDARARRRALDPRASFIVQAPAGSGKTELLIQRCLMLLAHVQRPEEIAAITFTRKAAAEMHKRIFDALDAARRGPRPQAPHKALTWELAKAALARSDRLGWRLEENAARLKVQTIDALCSALTHRMPVLARFGAPLSGTDDAVPYYREAARNTLALLEEDDEAAAADVARLLAHVDNDARVAEALLATMLRSRDHWLRNLFQARDRGALERSIEALRRDEVRRALALWPPHVAAPVATDLTLPGAIDAWIAFAEEALTAAGRWRKRHPIANPLADRDELLAALRLLRALPPAGYDDAQWEALEAMVRLLPRAIVELKRVFAVHGEADFVEIAQGALAALGSEEAPTDLLLALDYRIHHILVDEFQDTSFTQFELLEKLTAGWQPDDGRTLFVVGDPMQSIYRFRQAEVGLFLQARRIGIGPVALEPLALSANFRSQRGLVAWVNAMFATLMPAQEDVAAGAVTYAESHAVNPDAGSAVSVHAFFDGDREGEARHVAELVRAARAQDPDATVAILVRNRQHLSEVVPALRAAGLKLRAVEIEPLGHRPVIQDLLALTRAIAHLGDRTAWLSILRAPWCGLTLADLHALAAVGSEPDPPTIWELSSDPARVAAMSADGRERLERLRGVLAHCLAGRFRTTLRAAVEGVWLALGGPACLDEATDLEDAEIYLDLLEEEEVAGALADAEAFERRVAALYALPELDADAGLQAMTIHKAKGLEFDTVILPGLGGGLGQDDRDMLLWLERPTADGHASLIVAPINPAGGDQDKLYEFVRALDRAKDSHETARLLYVAATRARHALHLSGVVNRDDHGVPKPPRKGTLLEKLWPGVAADFARAAGRCEMQPGAAPANSRAGVPVDQSLRRLSAAWRHPRFASAVPWNAPAEAPADVEIEYSWAGETARRIGTVAHRWLQRIAEDELSGWNTERVRAVSGAIKAELAESGIGAAELESAAARVGSTLSAALEDERGRWALGPQAESRCEYRLTAIVGGRPMSLAIDRTFVEAGRRWVVDYKTGAHEGAELAAFLDRECERYAPVMGRYAAAFPAEAVQLGLYYPLVRGWRDWSGR